MFSAMWIKAAVDRAASLRADGGPRVILLLEPGGISASAGGEYRLRTWDELDRANVDPLTPIVDAIARRVARPAAKPPA